LKLQLKMSIAQECTLWCRLLTVHRHWTEILQLL